MARNYEQSKNRGDIRKIQASREEKSKTLDVRESSKRLSNEQKAISQNFMGITSDSHPSTSGIEKTLPSRNQASETEQVLRNHLALVGQASTRDLSKRVVDLKKRPDQEENQIRRDKGFKVSKRFTLKQLMHKFKMCRSQGTSEVQWSSNKQTQHRLSSSNSKRDIGSTNLAASSSVDWAKKREEAGSAKTAYNTRIKQLQHEIVDLKTNLEKQKNNVDRRKTTVEIEKKEREIQLAKFKKQNSITLENVYATVHEATKRGDLKK